jgi:hypothetical protein
LAQRLLVSGSFVVYSQPAIGALPPKKFADQLPRCLTPTRDAAGLAEASAQFNVLLDEAGEPARSYLLERTLNKRAPNSQYFMGDYASGGIAIECIGLQTMANAS